MHVLVLAFDLDCDYVPSDFVSELVWTPGFASIGIAMCTLVILLPRDHSAPGDFLSKNEGFDLGDGACLWKGFPIFPL